MAPEQARGDGKAIGPWTDIHALGAILYRLLAGRPPFQGPSLEDIRRRVIDQDPVSVRQFQSQAPRDLGTICLKCLEKDPKARYPSALELAEELRRFREHEPIHARPTAPLQRLIKWARRRPNQAALLAVSLFAILLLVGGLVWHTVIVERERHNLALVRGELDEQKQQLQNSREQLGQERGKVKESQREVWLGRYVLDLNLAHQLDWKNGDVERARG
jgi:serine/threonine protein kinase